MKEKKKKRVHDFDPQKSRQRALFMGLSGDAFEKCGARHLPAVPPGDQSYAEGETIGGQCGEVSGSLLLESVSTPRSCLGENLGKRVLEVCPFEVNHPREQSCRTRENFRYSGDLGDPQHRGNPLFLQKKPVSPISALRW